MKILIKKSKKDNNMSYEKFFKDLDLNHDEIFSIYYIAGEDRFLQQKCLDVIISKIKRKKTNTEFYYINNKNIGRLLDLCESVPLGCDFKCIVLQDVELDKFDSKELEILSEIFLDIPDYCCIIIFNINITVSKTKIKKIIEIIKNKGKILDLKKPNILQITDFVTNRFENLNFKISGQNAKILVQYCSNDLNKIDQEINKLESYCREKNSQEILKQDIDLLVIPGLETRVFDILKLINEKNQIGALKILNELLENKEDPTAILAIISMNFLDLYRAKVLKQERKTIQDLASLFDYKNKEFRLNNAITRANRYSLKQIKNIIDILVKSDYELKMSSADKREKKLVLEKTIIKIILD